MTPEWCSRRPVGDRSITLPRRHIQPAGRTASRLGRLVRPTKNRPDLVRSGRDRRTTPMWSIMVPSVEGGGQSWHYVLGSMGLAGSAGWCSACWPSGPRISRSWRSTTCPIPSTWRCCSSMTASKAGSKGRSRRARRASSSTARRSRSPREKDPAKLPWKKLGCQVALESTGLFTDRAKLQKHLDAGAERVVLERPGQGQARRHDRAGRQRPDPEQDITGSSPTRPARPTAWRRWPRCCTRRSASRRA